MTTQHPEALRLAEELDDGYPLTGDAISAAAELRSQHARIAELEAQLSAIGAGGVSLLIAQQHSTAHSALPEGWVPCTIAFDGDAEDVAYGPKPMMDRLAKWLGKHFERVVAEKNAAQQSAPSPAPAGWKLVPVEPTEGMLKAADDGDDAYTLRCFGPGVQRVMQGPYDHYCAMLDAAPTAQADTQPAQQGVSYAALPESFLEIPDVQDESGINAYYSREVVLECIDAALASHGQVPAGATEPTEQQILEAAEKAGLWPNTVRSWIPAFHRYHKELAKAQPAPAQADSVLEDAARYRWLAEHCRSTSEHWGGRWSIVVEGPAPKSHDSEDDFDAAIDAGRKQGANHDNS